MSFLRKCIELCKGLKVTVFQKKEHSQLKKKMSASGDNSEDASKLLYDKVNSLNMTELKEELNN